MDPAGAAGKLLAETEPDSAERGKAARPDKVARVAKPAAAEKADAPEDSGRARVRRARAAPEPAGEANGNKAVKLAVKDAGADKAAVQAR